ncbi:unnamed protein product [Callosobruchus maculatus]|uniref:Partial AB-hydrolase lipase domain-containing protein n=1 Tax=Callosobruchus maculatus TaxID=64391 RepID=A0A653BQS0_CALMS|nr:unnamed protein product [Callosobruchus maculatus]
MYGVQVIVLLLVFSNSLRKGDASYELFLGILGELFQSDNVLPSDYGLNVTTYVEKQGYPLESHEVVTEDGYILTVHRIPHGVKNGTDGKRERPPVLMMHSLLCSSMDWLYLGPEKSLGFLLAEAGYDVWMGNVRGNTWSRKHVKLDPDRDNDFWEFTFHEHGYYDVGAYIDHILNVTKHKQLYYIGHSQGTTELFILTSMRPEYNEKIIHGISLAPIAFMTDVRSPIIGMMVKFKRQLNNLFELFNVRELLSSSKLIKEAGKVLCADGSPFQEYCSLVIFSLAGFDSPQLNKVNLSSLTMEEPKI